MLARTGLVGAGIEVGDIGSGLGFMTDTTTTLSDQSTSLLANATRDGGRGGW